MLSSLNQRAIGNERKCNWELGVAGAVSCAMENGVLEDNIKAERSVSRARSWMDMILTGFQNSWFATIRIIGQNRLRRQTQDEGEANRLRPFCYPK